MEPNAERSRAAAGARHPRVRLCRTSRPRARPLPLKLDASRRFRSAFYAAAFGRSATRVPTSKLALRRYRSAQSRSFAERSCATSLAVRRGSRDERKPTPVTPGQIRVSPGHRQFPPMGSPGLSHGIIHRARRTQAARREFLRRLTNKRRSFPRFAYQACSQIKRPKTRKFLAGGYFLKRVDLSSQKPCFWPHASDAESSRKDAKNYRRGAEREMTGMRRGLWGYRRKETEGPADGD